MDTASLYRYIDSFMIELPSINCVSSTNLQPENRQAMAPEVLNRFADDTESKVQVKQITLPDLSVPMQLGRREPFSLFIPKHRKLAARLIDIFIGSSPTLFTVHISCLIREFFNYSIKCRK